LPIAALGKCDLRHWGRNLATQGLGKKSLIMGMGKMSCRVYRSFETLVTVHVSPMMHTNATKYNCRFYLAMLSYLVIVFIVISFKMQWALW